MGRLFKYLTVFVIVSCTLQHHLVGLVVKASASRAEDPGFESRLRRDFSGSNHTSDLKNWHSGGYPVRRLAILGQCPVSVCRDWVRWKVGSATSISV